ncbi:hypothetical protein H8959_012488 [Pygathrix nigripes]
MSCYFQHQPPDPRRGRGSGCPARPPTLPGLARNSLHTRNAEAPREGEVGTALRPTRPTGCVWHLTVLRATVEQVLLPHFSDRRPGSRSHQPTRRPSRLRAQVGQSAHLRDFPWEQRGTEATHPASSLPTVN